MLYCAVGRWSSSFASQHFTKAGRSRSRCMLAVPIGVLGALTAADSLRAVERRLLQGRSSDDDRPGGEERHSDRRIRQGPAWPAGMGLLEATLEAARLRLRPIVVDVARLPSWASCRWPIATGAGLRRAERHRRRRAGRHARCNYCSGFSSCRPSSSSSDAYSPSREKIVA